MSVTNRKSSKIISFAVATLMLFTCFIIAPDYVSADGQSQPIKEPYKNGDSIGNAVFYILEDVDSNGKYNNGDKIYYFSEDEIKKYDETVKYSFDNHSAGENVDVKGAKLTSLLCNLSGSAVGLKTSGAGFEANDGMDKWLIQYLEYDGFHIASSGYKDTVKELYDTEENSSTYPGPAETIIGWCGKTTYDRPDANNVNDKDYVSFSEYTREASPLRGYRQTTSANASVLKMLMGVVISNPSVKAGGSAVKGPGYTVEHYNDKSANTSSFKVDDDFNVMGLVEGMDWAVKAPNLSWATLKEEGVQETDFDAATNSIKITVGSGSNTKVRFNYTENEYFSIDYNGASKKSFVRSDFTDNSVEYPRSKSYTYYGYNKPMYVRYQGVWLDEYFEAGTSDKIYLVTKDGTTKDITDTAKNYFIAYYYSQSKSATNISNGKRVPLNYSYAVLVDTKSAPVEYSSNGSDFTAKSGKSATEYYNAKVVIANISAPTTINASSTAYNSATVNWDKVNDANGYELFRSVNGGDYSQISSITNNSTTTFTDNTLSPGLTYSYKVQAYKNVGGVKVSSPFSTTVSVKSKLNASKITKIKKSGKTSAKVTYKKVAGADGYQIVYGTNKKITKNKKTVTVKKGSTTKKTIKKLKKGKKYYVKVRAYKKVNGQNVYGAFSKVKSFRR